MSLKKRCKSMALKGFMFKSLLTLFNYGRPGPTSGSSQARWVLAHQTEAATLATDEFFTTLDCMQLPPQTACRDQTFTAAHQPLHHQPEAVLTTGVNKQATRPKPECNNDDNNNTTNNKDRQRRRYHFIPTLSSNGEIDVILTSAHLC